MSQKHRVETVGTVNKTQITECEFEWRIPDFLSLSGRDGECYSSPSFTFANESWYLKIFPNGRKAYDSVGYVGVYLTKSSFGPPLSLEFSLGLKNSDGKKDQDRSYLNVFEEPEEEYGAPKMISRSELTKKKTDLISSNALTVLCTMTYAIEDSDDTETSKSSSCEKASSTEILSSDEKKCLDKSILFLKCSNIVVSPNQSNQKPQMAKETDEVCSSTSSFLPPENRVLYDFKQLFLKKEDCDVILKVKGKEFPAHKPILKARSPVFASAFRYDTKEKTNGIVDIDDCEPSSFADFLCFLYCGNVENFSEDNVFSLFTTADKYDVQDLRANCLEFMRDNLSVETFCDTITLGLQHSETSLVDLTTDFFTKNAPKIIVRAKWRQFLSDYPTQGNELLIKLLSINKKLNK